MLALPVRCGPVTIEHDPCARAMEGLQARNMTPEKRQGWPRRYFGAVRLMISADELGGAGMNRWIPTLDG